MWKQFKTWFLYTFFQSDMVAAFNYGVDSGKTNYLNQRFMDRNKAEFEHLEQFIGKKVIVLHNLWADPLFGYALRVEPITQAQQPILVVRDALTGDEMMVFGKVFNYTDSLMNNVLALDPSELWELAAGQTMTLNENHSLSDLTPDEELIEQLKEVDYLEPDFVHDLDQAFLEVFNEGVKEGEKNAEMRAEAEALRG